MPVALDSVPSSPESGAAKRLSYSNLRERRTSALRYFFKGHFLLVIYVSLFSVLLVVARQAVVPVMVMIHAWGRVVSVCGVILLVRGAPSSPSLLLCDSLLRLPNFAVPLPHPFVDMELADSLPFVYDSSEILTGSQLSMGSPTNTVVAVAGQWNE